MSCRFRARDGSARGAPGISRLSLSYIRRIRGWAAENRGRRKKLFYFFQSVVVTLAVSVVVSVIVSVVVSVIVSVVVSVIVSVVVSVVIPVAVIVIPAVVLPVLIVGHPVIVGAGGP